MPSGTCPFYRNLWADAGVRSGQLRTLDDLRRWPVVTKQQLKQAGDRCLSGGQRSAEDVSFRSSGSTGNVFETWVSRSERRTRLLIEFRTLMAMGFRPRDRLAVLGPIRARSPRLHERLGLYRTEVLTVDLSAGEQVAALRRFDPTILWAYPDTLQSLLAQLDGPLHEVTRPRLLITSSAVLPAGLGTRLRADLGCEFFSSYACSEVGRLAAECPAHRGLHVNADHVIVEFEEQDWLRDAGLGVVTVTALNAFRMPLIRYRLGDFSRPLTGRCPCGCEFPRIEAPLGPGQ